MRAKNRTLGVIRVYTGEPHVFSEQEQKLLMNVANLGAIAILNARSYGELLALDQERVWFARTTHHELRAPLAAAQGAMEALSFAGPLTKMQQDLVARAQRRIQESFDMIRDLLDLAAAQRLEDQAALPLLSLAEALKPVLEAAREQALAKGLTFEEKFDLQGCLLRAGAADIARIFSNLLNNAVKYTRSGAVIFGARAADGWLEAWVQDTGMGIDEQDLGRIFKAFYRTVGCQGHRDHGNRARTFHRPAGRREAGGTISVASEPGRGTRFDVRLPLASGMNARALNQDGVSGGTEPGHAQLVLETPAINSRRCSRAASSACRAAGLNPSSKRSRSGACIPSRYPWGDALKQERARNRTSAGVTLCDLSLPAGAGGHRAEIERPFRVQGGVGEHHDVVLRGQRGMLDRELVVAFDGERRDLECLEARGQRRAETVVPAAGIAVADDQDPLLRPWRSPGRRASLPGARAGRRPSRRRRPPRRPAACSPWRASRRRGRDRRRGWPPRCDSAAPR